MKPLNLNSGTFNDPNGIQPVKSVLSIVRNIEMIDGKMVRITRMQLTCYGSHGEWAGQTELGLRKRDIFLIALTFMRLSLYTLFHIFKR